MIYIGLVAGSSQAAQGMSFMAFPFVFVSSAYVPVESMPGWMQPFAEHQPVTIDGRRGAVADAGRRGRAVLGHSTAWFIVRALLWAVGSSPSSAPWPPAASPARDPAPLWCVVSDQKLPTGGQQRGERSAWWISDGRLPITRRVPDRRGCSAAPTDRAVWSAPVRAEIVRVCGQGSSSACSSADTGQAPALWRSHGIGHTARRCCNRRPDSGVSGRVNWRTRRSRILGSADGLSGMGRSA